MRATSLNQSPDMFYALKRTYFCVVQVLITITILKNRFCYLGPVPIAIRIIVFFVSVCKLFSFLLLFVFLVRAATRAFVV